MPRLVAVLAAVALALAACSDAANDDGSGSPTPPAPGQNLGEKPEVEAPAGDPPTGLERSDLVEGDGEEAVEGATLTVHYVGVSWSTGEEFDSSWDRGEPFRFQLGVSRVIEGWHRGFAGMREGGRRMLVIPPDLAYAGSGAPPVIGPNETLIFVVDLVEVSAPGG